MNVFESRGDLFNKSAPRICHRNAARRTIEQTHAELSLQLSDRRTESTGGHADVECGGPKRSLATDGEHSVEIGQIVTLHYPEFRDVSSVYIPIIYTTTSQ